MDTISYFFKCVLPHIRPEFDIDRIYNLCVKDKALVKRGRSKRYTWKEAPNNSEEISANKYKSLFLSIFAAIIEAAQATTSNSSRTIPTRFVPTTDKRNKCLEREFGVEQDDFIYLEDPHDNCLENTERKYLYNVAFSLHFKGSKQEAFEVSFVTTYWV